MNDPLTDEEREELVKQIQRATSFEDKLREENAQLKRRIERLKRIADAAAEFCSVVWEVVEEP